MLSSVFSHPIAEVREIPFAHRIYPKKHTVRVEKEQLNDLKSTTFYTHTSPLASHVHWFNEQVIFAPFYAFIHCKAYFENPCPGEGKEMAPWKQTLKKTAAFFGCVSTVLPSLPSVCLGLAVRAAEHGSRPLFCYLVNPDIPDAPLLKLTKQEPAHIAVLNAALIPSSVCIEQDVRPAPIRAKEIAKSISEDKRRPSILFLEEGWNREAMEIFCLEMKKIYPHILYHTAPTLFGMGAGIAVFSMFPFEEVDYVCFDHMVPPHHFPARGFLEVTIKTEQGPLYCIGGIHTQSLDGEVFSHARKLQIEQVHEYVEKRAKNQPACMQVILGDFNTSIVDIHGYDNRHHPENETLLAMNEYFEDPFLIDHDAVTGERTKGKPHFLDSDNERMGIQLPEPQSSWMDGSWTAKSFQQKLQRKLADEAKKNHYPERTMISGKEIQETLAWGTSKWFQTQEAKRPRYDYALFPKREEQPLEGRVEYRRLIVDSKLQSAPSDHLLVSLQCYKKEDEISIHLIE